MHRTLYGFLFVRPVRGSIPSHRRCARRPLVTSPVYIGSDSPMSQSEGVREDSGLYEDLVQQLGIDSDPFQDRPALPRRDSRFVEHVAGPTEPPLLSHPYSQSFTRLPAPAVDDQPQAGMPVAGVFGNPAVQEKMRTEARSETVPAIQGTPFYKKKWFILSQVILALVALGLLFVILYPVVHAIAQHVVDVSALNIESVTIDQPGNTSFTMGIHGFVSHTGIFSADIEFPEPLDVFWVNGSDEVLIGRTKFAPLAAKKKRAVINQTTEFEVTDQNAFGSFTKTMITSQSFTWVLKTPGLAVRALRLPMTNGISFSKSITLPGINNFQNNIELMDFQLPSDAPNGAGINFLASTELNNPSPFALGLGTVVFNLTYKGVYLGQGSQPNTNIVPGPNIVNLTGILVPHNDSATDLQSVSELFTQYLNSETSNVTASGVSTLQPDGSTISWLSEGLQALHLDVPFKSPVPINPIRSISIETFNLSFSKSAPWAPVANTRTVQATLELPFGFNLEVSNIMNAFNISTNGANVGSLSTPLGASTSNITVFGRTNTSGTIDIQINDTPIDSPDDEHDNFASFNSALTNAEHEPFQLQGHAHALTNLSIGQITLDPIKFNVTSGLNGLQGLKNMVSIDGVDVVGGTTSAINLDINVTIQNPSNLNLNTGDLTMQLFQGQGLLGTVLLPNLTLDIGNNSVVSQSSFQPNSSPEGQQTLNNFVGGKNVEVRISGYSQSTEIASLLPAFETLSLDVTLPGLSTRLLSSASLEILPTTGHENNITHVTVELDNPFTSALQIQQIQSDVSFKGLLLGTINTNTNFSSAGHQTTSSPNLDLNLNMDPATLFTVTRALAVEAGLGTEQLDEIVQIGGIQYLSTTNTKREEIEAEISERAALARRDNIFTGFNLPSFVDTAFKKLTSDVNLTTMLTIGQYQTALSYSQAGLPTKTDESLNLILPILAQPIVQKIVGGSVLSVNNVLITNPQQTSFGAKLSGAISQSGPFDALISFGNGLTVNWNGQTLGTIKMPDINITGDVGGEFDVTTDFSIADVGHLTDFTRVLLTEESFDWEITGDNLTVSAIGISVPGISLPSKKVTLKGMNNLVNGVIINSFDLPANDPAGGIHLTLDTTITNPSQVGIELSSIGFQTFFGQTNIGPVASNNSFTLAPQSTVKLGLAGRLIPQTSRAGLDDVSTIFNRFIHGLDSNVSVHGDSAGPSSVTWLNDGIKSLTVGAVLPNQGKLNIIKSINLNELDLRFSEATAYDPSTSSDDTTAAFTIPFNFPVDITALEQNITVGTGGQSFAELVIPKGPSTTDVDTRVIHLTFSDVPFAVFGDDHSAFQQFLASTATSANQSLDLSGVANTDAQTAVGLLSLSDIEFSVSTSIAGLQGLNAKPVQLVSELDVNHGFSDFLLIKVNASLFNPSNITLGTGDVAFGLQFNDQTIGSADINDIVIVPGNGSYAVEIHYAPQGAAVPTGQLLLENFLQGVDSDTTIQGTQDSTDIDSLKLALSEIRLSPVTVPAIHQNIITSASLVFPPNIAQTGVAQTTFVLSNPFTASINLLEVTANATFGNLSLGSINHVDVSSNPIHADGHTKVTSPSLPFDFNLDPATIIQLLLVGAKNNGVDLGPLPGLFSVVLQNPSLHPPINTSVETTNPTCVSGKQFDVDDAILNSLKNLAVTLGIQSSVKIDDFATDLNFKQFNVSAITDKSALNLIGVVAPPIVQTLVDGAVLNFTAANITNLSNGGFDLSLEGSLTNIGPLDAQIAFVDPVTVIWQGNDIAQITLPDLCAAANSGIPNLRTNGHLDITNQDMFTQFATFLLHNPDFTWTISTNKLRVTALGTVFDGVTLSKDVSFKAFNNLPGVTISNFNLPSDDPAGGIHIETDSIIPSAAQLGIDLGTVGFEAFFQGVDVGPLTGNNLFLAPETSTKEHLSGRITPKSGSDLDVIGTLFSEFLAGKNQTLNVKGSFVQPSGSSSQVDWLSTAFKTLELDVTLPGQVFEVIQSITISDLELVMTEQSQAYAPTSSSKHTLAEYKNPFGFSLQVVASSQNITLGRGGVDIAQLNLPETQTVGGVSTGNVADLVITFENQTLQSLNNDAFNAFFAAVTNTATVPFDLKGSADVVGKTSIGNVPISGIPFNVSTSIAGLNGFGGEAQLSNVAVAGSGGNGGNEFILAKLTTTLNNPSNVSLQTVDISFPVIFQGTQLGRAVIPSLNLVPGENVVTSSEFHYQPANANDTVAQSFLSNFLQSNQSLPLKVEGDSNSSPFGSLVEGLEAISLSTSLQALNSPPIITHVNVFVTLDSLVTNLVSVNFDITNPLDTPLSVSFTQSDSGVNGQIFAHFDQGFTGFVVPEQGTANSGTFPNVLLTQGAIAALAIVPLGFLDVFAVSTVQVGEGGYVIPWLPLTQLHVPTDYNLDLLGLSSVPEVEGLASSVSASFAGHLSTSLPSVASTTKTSGSGASESTIAASASTTASASVSRANTDGVNSVAHSNVASTPSPTLKGTSETSH